mmetsp:Transcript_33331/g.41205  ORF Transcript_33331/g.41205 Transcript_33331/m.41205 type:complete len:91 (+) Transcript_33331:1257-1529(+)|eukprot:CAMPEP_0170459796 /NCGR_PEP_ID=MMETSP0123-20130129/6361_1 /TAXON_ID=182087 /ORGANISM="Favella ehrenbergii, Strain Fehren 1" /LENGTH=90 /DNA_ID=CAMNT_0010724493 /DNA_START=1242 /DNA_END=1514 /DNA_ORIENTATION=-
MRVNNVNNHTSVDYQAILAGGDLQQYCAEASAAAFKTFDATKGADKAPSKVVLREGKQLLMPGNWPSDLSQIEDSASSFLSKPRFNEKQE